MYKWCTAILNLLVASCSTGPQIPTTLPVNNITCNFYVFPDADCSGCACRIDRSWAEAKPVTTGNQVDEMDVDVPVNLNSSRRTSLDAGVAVDGG